MALTDNQRLAAPNQDETEQGESEPDEPGIYLSLSPAQAAARAEYRQFVDQQIVPFAGEWERQRAVPASLIDQLRERGYLAAMMPQSLGGGGLDAIRYGLLTEQLGRGCSSVRSLLTVHDMVTLALARWGSASVKEEVVPRLARGEAIGALGLSEPNIGSDAAAVETVAERLPDGSFRLDGHKKWTTFGQIADYVLVLAQCEGKPTAFVVPATAPGFSRRPLEGFMGTAASRVAEILLDDCRVPAENLLARVGFGASHVTLTALDHGRYSVAWGSVGIAQGCLDACQSYAVDRIQGGGKRLIEHQLIRRLLTEMIVRTRAARLLCLRAGHLREIGDPGALAETMVAKYAASRAATRAANDAVQLHGANGLSDDYPVARYLRDSKVMEIIEGSSQIQQITIAGLPLEEI
jgi:hypothetical protein